MITFIDTNYTAASHSGLSLYFSVGGLVRREEVKSLRLRASETPAGPRARQLLDEAGAFGYLAQVTIDGEDLQVVMNVKMYQAMRANSVGTSVAQKFVNTAAAVTTRVTGAKKSCCGGG